MLLEFCEEDIQDAFSVFKDRFIIRKVLREQKSLDSSNHPPANNSVVFPPSKSSPELHYTHQRRPASPEPYTLRKSPQYTATRTGLPSPSFTVSRNSNPSANQNSIHAQDHGDTRQTRGVISLVNTETERVVPVQIHPNISNSHPPASPTSSRSVSRRHSNELMNAKVSSTDEARVLKHKEKVEESSANVYDSAIDALVSLSNKHTGVSETNAPRTPDSQGLNLCVDKSGATSPQQNYNERQSTSSETSLPSASSIYGLNYDCTYAWNVMSNKVKSFSAEELLSKRNRFGKPSEGQRLGGILIRNAAHAAGLWSDAPCLHEISLPQKKDFFKFIVSVAPQLANSQNVLFIRLREALQNRRKYLLDKKLGKVQARRRRGPSDVGIEISDSGSFIDLSDISDEVEMNTDEIFVKTEEMIKKE